MLSIFLKYNFHSLWVRKITTLLTVLGIALVVAVFLAVMALSEGLSHVFVSSGSPKNVLVVRQASQSELQSGITRDQVPLISTLPGIEKDTDGRPLLSRELMVIVSAEKKDGGTGNLTMRGVQEKGFSLRPALKLTKGRMFVPGLSEVIVSKSVASRFKHCEIGDVLSFGTYRWKVVGEFEAGGTAPDSEIWTDTEGLMRTFNRDLYTSVLVRTTDTEGQSAFIEGLVSDPRLALDGRNERKYYDDQTQVAAPIKFLGTVVGVIMAIGACFGTMNTMYAAVSSRTREIATLRVLGFPRFIILSSFVLESMLIGLIGGLIGLVLGSLVIKWGLSGVTGTTSFVTFSEVIFAFRITPKLLLSSLLFALAMGFFGGILPAGRAAFVKITQALRQS